MSEKIIDSILEVKAVAGLDAKEDLTLRDGKSIADLLDDQEKAEKAESTEQCERDGISSSS